MKMILPYTEDNIKDLEELLLKLKEFKDGLIVYKEPIKLLYDEASGDPILIKLSFAIWNPKPNAVNDSPGAYEITFEEHKRNVDKILSELKEIRND